MESKVRFGEDGVIASRLPGPWTYTIAYILYWHVYNLYPTSI